MVLRPDVEEISEDLLAAPRLFSHQDTITQGLEAIVEYLEESEREYTTCHEHIRTSTPLDQAIETHCMAWTKDFMAGGQHFTAAYDANLQRSKGAMRRQVYGEESGLLRRIETRA
jgi:hypothetical protein